MGYQLERLKTAEGCGTVNAEEMRQRIERLRGVEGARLRRMWAYYRNPIRSCAVSGESGAERPYRQAQEWGLPARITGTKSGRELLEGQASDGVTRKEVVIENDIGWRIDTMVDYLFGKPLVIRSSASDPERREIIDRLVRAIIAHNGGLLFLQQLALLGAVYGFVDVLVKLDTECFYGAGWPKLITDEQTPTGRGGCGRQELGEPPLGTEAAQIQGSADEQLIGGKAGGSGGKEGDEPATSAESTTLPAEESSGASPDAASDLAETGARRHSLEALIQRIARMIRLEIVEPTRALPFLAGEDYRIVEAYGQVYEKKLVVGSCQWPGSRCQSGEKRWWDRLIRSARGWMETEMSGGRRGEEMAVVTEIITAQGWQRYEDETLVGEGTNSLGEIPLVHIQNSALPFEYSGASDVEPLIPLQDELNTRLSDRANRIAMQSFKMYLGKGIEGFADLPVSPGRMWTTENSEAEVVEFGGDASCPSESLHIADLREALDKVSGVTPIAAGAIKDRIGRLTSAAALRITLIALLARTEKKRTTYGLGLQRMIELSLAWLDRAGVFRTDVEERRVELHWPSPLPENTLERLQEAEAKAKLGVPREVVLRELGY
ncbi:MAG: phage portal protein [Bacillota bacterium]